MEKEQKMITAWDVAKELKTSHSVVAAAIKAGILPIGFVTTNESGRQRVIIVPERWEAYRTGQDIISGFKRFEEWRTSP